MRVAIKFYMRVWPLTIAGSILFAGDEGLGVEETPVGTRPYLINDVGLKVDVE